MLPVFCFCLKDEHPLFYFLIVFAVGIVDEELLIELRIGDAFQPLVIFLFLLFHSVLVVEVVTCAEQNKTDDYGDDGRTFRLVWLFLLFDGFCLRLSCLRLRLLLCCDGFQLCSTFRAFALGLEAIASATGTLPQVARYVCAAMRTSSGHCGDLATTFRTFDDAHLIYNL